MIAVKSSVQAVDPACGIWLVGKVLTESDDSYHIRWADYRVTDWIAKVKVRIPIPKRQCWLDSSDWKQTQPSLYQKGDRVVVKKADGTSGEIIIVEENDPFNCVLYGNKRRLKYEWIREVGPVQITDDRLPFAEVVNREKEPGSSRSTAQSDIASHQLSHDLGKENETPHRRPAAQNKRQTIYETPFAPKKTKTLVPKKIATCFAVRPAVPGDDGGQPQEEGMAAWCENSATMAHHSLMLAATTKGHPPPLPGEWSRATTAFSCSAVCDSRFAVMQMKLQKQSREIAELRRRLGEMERRQKTQPQKHLQAIPLRTLAPVTTIPPPQPALPSAVGSALTSSTGSEQVAPPVQTESSLVHSLRKRYLQDRQKMAKILMMKFFTTEERFFGSTSGKRGKAQLDIRKLMVIRTVIFKIAPVPTHEEEEREWARLRAVMDQYNRHLRQHLRQKDVAQ